MGDVGVQGSESVVTNYYKKKELILIAVTRPAEEGITHVSGKHIC